MGNWRFKVAVVVVTLLLVLPSCGKREGPNSLAQAMAMMPADVRRFGFTNWTLIKQYERAEELTSRDSVEKRITFFRSLLHGQTTPHLTDIISFDLHAETWGWDGTDLLWEASALHDGPPIRVLRLRDDFDFAPLEARFEQRGFDLSEYRGVPIYSHELQVGMDWYVPGHLAIFNTAIMAQDGILVLSAKIDSIYKVLDVYRGGAASLFDEENVQTVVSCLGGVAAAIVSTDMCAILGDEVELSPAAVEERHGLNPKRVHAYSVFALGYWYEETQPVGRMVMQYARAEDAQSDLAVRSDVIRDGIGLDGVPYREVMTLKDASVQGNTLVLQLRPVDDRPSRLFDMVLNLNLAFAICP
jgi:hypothetical protein